MSLWFLKPELRKVNCPATVAAGAASCNDDALAMRAARCGVLDIDEVVARAKRAKGEYDA